MKPMRKKMNEGGHKISYRSNMFVASDDLESKDVEFKASTLHSSRLNQIYSLADGED